MYGLLHNNFTIFSLTLMWKHILYFMHAQLFYFCPSMLSRSVTTNQKAAINMLMSSLNQRAVSSVPLITGCQGSAFM